MFDDDLAGNCQSQAPPIMQSFNPPFLVVIAFENLGQNLRRNPDTLILDFHPHIFLVAAQAEGDITTYRAVLDSVVEDRS